MLDPSKLYESSRALIVSAVVPSVRVFQSVVLIYQLVVKATPPAWPRSPLPMAVLPSDVTEL